MPGIAGVLHLSQSGPMLGEREITWLTAGFEKSLEQGAAALCGDIRVLGQIGTRCAVSLAVGPHGPTFAAVRAARSGGSVTAEGGAQAVPAWSERPDRPRPVHRVPGGLDLDRVLWVLCDGRVDNYDELGEEARRVGAPSAECASAAELILGAYLRYGADCPKHVIGDYAFVLWDPDQGRLMIARDPGKFRTVYYYWDEAGQRLLFGSDPRILLASQSILSQRTPGDEYDLTYLTTFCVIGNLNWERTPYEAIKQVPGGFRLLLTRGTEGRILRTVDRWWHLPSPGSLKYKRDEDYQEHLRQLYRLAVTPRLRTSGTGPVSIALSRGIDSASVAATAMALTNASTGMSSSKIIQAITVNPIAFKEADESQGACKIAEHLHLSHLIVAVDKASWQLHEPTEQMRMYAEPNTISTYNFLWQCILSTCRSTESSVLLSGAGGGELFDTHSAHYLSSYLINKDYKGAVLEVYRWKKRGFSTGSAVRRMLEGVFRETVPPNLSDLKKDTPWINQDYIDSTQITTWPASIHPMVRSAQYCFTQQASGAPGIYELAMKYGVECRHPLWDRRLVEFSYRLPIEMRLPRPHSVIGSVNKPLLRTAFDRDVPMNITGLNGSLVRYVCENLSFGYQQISSLLTNPPPIYHHIFQDDVLRKHMSELRYHNHSPMVATYHLLCWLYSREL